MTTPAPDHVLTDRLAAERTRRRLAIALPVAALVLVAALGAAWITDGAPSAGARQPAPAFEVTLIDGDTVSRADYAGRALVVNFWASWCPPCREEAPVLRDAHRAADPADVAFLGVVWQDDADSAIAFAADHGLDYPHTLDGGDIAGAYDLEGLPMTVVIGRDGTIVGRHFGAIASERLRALIDDALARAPGSP